MQNTKYCGEDFVGVTACKARERLQLNSSIIQLRSFGLQDQDDDYVHDVHDDDEDDDDDHHHHIETKFCFLQEVCPVC